MRKESPLSISTSSCDAPAVHRGKDMLMASDDATCDIDERQGSLRYDTKSYPNRRRPRKKAFI